MKKPLEALSGTCVLLTEAGEQQWLDQLLDEAAAQLRHETPLRAPAQTARHPTPQRPRKAA